jgi:uncharacterized protein
VVPLRRWFLPETPDLLGLLVAQGNVTTAGMDALCAWADGDLGQEAEVRAREHEADRARRELLVAVRRAFVTPISPEDVYELSERLDNVLNGAKNLVRETELLAMNPDPPMAAMTSLATAGVRDLVEAFGLLHDRPDQATELADTAVKRQREVERAYRRAMSALLDVDDVREVIGRRELYRRCARMSDAVVGVAHRIWYAVVKES